MLSTSSKVCGGGGGGGCDFDGGGGGGVCVVAVVVCVCVCVWWWWWWCCVCVRVVCKVMYRSEVEMLQIYTPMLLFVKRMIMPDINITAYCPIAMEILAISLSFRKCAT